MKLMTAFLLGVSLLGTVQATAENRANKMLLDSTPAEQAYFLGEAVEQNGNGACTGEEALFMGSAESGAAHWSVRCYGGTSYFLSIEADANGTTSILDCRVLKSVSGGDCFKKY